MLGSVRRLSASLCEEDGSLDGDSDARTFRLPGGRSRQCRGPRPAVTIRELAPALSNLIFPPPRPAPSEFLLQEAMLISGDERVEGLADDLMKKGGGGVLAVLLHLAGSAKERVNLEPVTSFPLETSTVATSIFGGDEGREHPLKSLFEIPKVQDPTLFGALRIPKKEAPMIFGRPYVLDSTDLLASALAVEAHGPLQIMDDNEGGSNASFDTSGSSETETPLAGSPEVSMDSPSKSDVESLFGEYKPLTFNIIPSPRQCPVKLLVSGSYEMLHALHHLLPQHLLKFVAPLPERPIELDLQTEQELLGMLDDETRRVYETGGDLGEHVKKREAIQELEKETRRAERIKAVRAAELAMLKIKRAIKARAAAHGEAKRKEMASRVSDMYEHANRVVEPEPSVVVGEDPMKGSEEVIERYTKLMTDADVRRKKLQWRISRLGRSDRLKKLYSGIDVPNLTIETAARVPVMPAPKIVRRPPGDDTTTESNLVPSTRVLQDPGGNASTTNDIKSDIVQTTRVLQPPGGPATKQRVDIPTTRVLLPPGGRTTNQDSSLPSTRVLQSPGGDMSTPHKMQSSTRVLLPPGGRETTESGLVPSTRVLQTPGGKTTTPDAPKGVKVLFSPGGEETTEAGVVPSTRILQAPGGDASLTAAETPANKGRRTYGHLVGPNIRSSEKDSEQKRLGRRMYPGAGPNDSSAIGRLFTPKIGKTPSASGVVDVEGDSDVFSPEKSVSVCDWTSTPEPTPELFYVTPPAPLKNVPLPLPLQDEKAREPHTLILKSLNLHVLSTVPLGHHLEAIHTLYMSPYLRAHTWGMLSSKSSHPQMPLAIHNEVSDLSKFIVLAGRNIDYEPPYPVSNLLITFHKDMLEKIRSRIRYFFTASHSLRNLHLSSMSRKRAATHRDRTLSLLIFDMASWVSGYANYIATTIDALYQKMKLKLTAPEVLELSVSQVPEIFGDYLLSVSNALFLGDDTSSAYIRRYIESLESIVDSVASIARNNLVVRGLTINEVSESLFEYIADKRTTFDRCKKEIKRELEGLYEGGELKAFIG